MSILLRLFLLLIALPIFAYALYDLLVFQPRMGEIEQRIAQATEDERAPPESLKALMIFSSRGVLSGYVTRRLIMQLPVAYAGTLDWHVTNLLWEGLVALHLNEEEKVTLWLTDADMGALGRGFSQAAEAYFDKPLGALSLEEQATLIVLVRGPSHYLQHPERLASRRGQLLNRYRRSLESPSAEPVWWRRFFIVE